jgi:hypothetical protein
MCTCLYIQLFTKENIKPSQSKSKQKSSDLFLFSGIKYRHLVQGWFLMGESWKGNEEKISRLETKPRS